MAVINRRVLTPVVDERLQRLFVNAAVASGTAPTSVCLSVLCVIMSWTGDPSILVTH